MNKLFDMWIPDAKNRDSALDAVMTKVENGNAKNEKRDLGAQEQQQGQQGQQDQQGQQNEQKQNQQEGQQKSWWQSFREKLSGAQQKNENQEHQESNQQQQNDQQQQNGQQHQNDQQQQINQQNQNQHSAQLHERIAPQVEDFSSNKETSHEHLHERSQMNPQFESNHDETNKQDDADCDKGKEMQMQADGQMQPRSEQGDMERMNSENSEIQEQKDGRQEAEGKQRDEREQKEQREENQLQERAQGRQDMREGEMEGLESEFFFERTLSGLEDADLDLSESHRGAELGSYRDAV